MLGIEPHPVGLPDSIFRKHYDNMLVTGELNPEILELCNSYQMFAINELKKALVRLTNKHARQIIEDTE